MLSVPVYFNVEIGNSQRRTYEPWLKTVKVMFFLFERIQRFGELFIWMFVYLETVYEIKPEQREDFRAWLEAL